MIFLHHMFKLLLVSFIAISVSGCALWPQLKADADLTPSTAKDNLCLKPENAENCALLTMEEISGMLEDAGNFDRATAYVLLGLGTATGATLAFEGSEDLLKGLAVGTGALLGLDAVVNTDGQKKVLKAGLKSMSCAYRASMSLGEAVTSLTGVKDLSTLTAITLTNKLTNTLTDKAAELSVSSYKAFDDQPAIKRLTKEEEQNMSKADVFTLGQKLGQKTNETVRQNLKFKAVSLSNNKMIAPFASAQLSAAQKLSAAVISIRAEVRQGLADTVPNLDEIERNQSKRIVDMVGEVQKRRADLKDKDQDTGAGTDSNQEKLSNAAKMLIVATAPVAAAFNDCTDPATQRVIGET